MLSGVWPGVARNRRRTLPRRISSPSRTARCGKRGPRSFSEYDRGAGAIGELPVSAHEVGVEVSLEDPPDRQSLRSGFGDVLVHVATRIDDRRLPAVTDEIRCLRETPQVELLEEHRISNRI